MSRRPLLVYGLGRSGGAVVERARDEGLDVLFMDDKPAGSDIDQALGLGARRVLRLEDALREAPTTCVAAPGVPIDHPDLLSLQASGVEVIGEVVWVMRNWPATSVGITGTAGKGTVTRWLERSLLAAGIDAVAGGNIDPALAKVARPGATLVIELSSFQLERAAGLRPDVAVLLNLGVDHLDRHHDLAAYHGAKLNLLRELGPEQSFVGNLDDPLVADCLATSPAKRLGFSLERPAEGYWEQGSDVLFVSGTPLLRAAELQVKGRHQVANALAVALAATALGVEAEPLRQALAAFRGLPGRQTLLGRLGDVRFVEDSIATRNLSVAAALEASEAPVVWIAGGVDKGADLPALATLLREKVALTLGIGRSGDDVCQQASAYGPAERVAEVDGRTAMQQAVRRAWHFLQEEADGRGTVLLAPLAASFDQFRDYRDRADAFGEAVAALADEVGSAAGQAKQQGGQPRWIPCS